MSGTTHSTRERRARWPVRTRILVGLAAGWTVSLALFLLLTGRYWWWRPMELVPPLVFLAVPALLAALAPLARPVRGRVAAAALGCAVVGAHLSGLNLAALSGGAATAAPPGAIRIFSWNTEYWADGDDLERFYRFLAEQRADVYLLQEHVGWDLARHRPVPVDHREELRRRFPDFHVVAIGELLTMSRFPVVRSLPVDNLPYLSDPAVGGPPADTDFPDYYRYKALRTDLDLGGQVLSVYNVHVPVQLDITMDPRRADFYQFMRSQEDRRQALYRALRADLARNPAPTVVSGDFNATAAMGELREFGARLRDALPASGKLYLASWPASHPLWRLDWSFTAGPVRVHEYRMVPSHGLSDHWGQVVAVSVLAQADTDTGHRT